MPLPLRHGRQTYAWAVLGTAALVAATGCQGLGSDRGNGSGRAAAPPQTSVPRVAVVGLQGGRVGSGTAIRLEVADGQIRGPVTATPSLTGAANATGTAWVSSAATAAATTYRISADVVDKAGVAHRVVTSVPTSSKARTLHAHLSPGDSAVVGIGMPVTVTFDHAVAKADRGAVEKRLRVTTKRPLTGAWYWLSSKEVHFRPVTYWPTHEPVRVQVNLPGLYLADGLWGGARRTSAFSIGADHRSVADVRSHQFTVYSGGHEVKTYPASMGSHRWPSKGGMHIALESEPVHIMDSSTIGIPNDGPGGYRETVYWDVRISWGGAFVHAAPWSVGAQGNTNVSHGCVNLSPSAAKWFYHFTQLGDLINVVHASVAPESWDPGTADWNMSWKSWLAGSATGAQRTATSTPVTPVAPVSPALSTPVTASPTA